jgi:hypothetical protein
MDGECIVYMGKNKKIKVEERAEAEAKMSKEKSEEDKKLEEEAIAEAVKIFKKGRWKLAP